MRNQPHHFETEAMKKVVFSTAALLAIGAIPAHAVDYVKCEAMQKASSRLSVTRDSEAEAAGKRVMGRLLQEKCRAGEVKDVLECTKTVDLSEAVAASEAIKSTYEERLAKVQADYEAEGCY